MDDQMLHHFMQDLLPIVVLPVMVIAAAWLISLIIATFRHRATLRARAELYNRILDKFGSADEFTAYLQTEDGRGFFESQAVETSAPLTRILNSVKIGTILFIVSGGFFVLSLIAKTEDSIFALNVLCIVILTLGIGFLASSLLSYKLAKRWGIIKPVQTPPAVQPTVSTTAAP